VAKELLLAPIAGLVAGFVGTLLGIGGGAIMVPLLTLAGLDIKRVVPASLLAILGTSTGGLRRLFHEGLVDYRLAVILELASTTGALTGVEIFGRLKSRELIVALGIVLILSGILFLIRQRTVEARKTRGEYTPIRLRERKAHLAAAMAVSYIAGMLSAMLGIGGGVIKVPILVLVLNLPIHAAVSTSKLMVGITAAAGVAGHIAAGTMDWTLALLLLAGTYTGATLSTRVLLKTRPRILYIIAAAYYFTMGTYLLAKTLA
jgi:uncharacterized membrane protein YfcA